VVAPASALWGVLLLVIVAGALGSAWAVLGRRRTAAGLGAIGGVTVGLLVLLAISGSAAPAQSWAGVRYWEGRSFHGLGSILAGTVVAGTLLALGALARRTRRSRPAQLAVAGAAVLIFIVLSLPSVGGTPVVGIAGLGGATVGTILLGDRRPSRRTWTTAAAVGAAVLVVLGGLAIAGQVAQSRPTEALIVSEPGAASAAASILVRRAAWASRLLLFSPWTLAILSALAAVAYAYLRPRGPLESAPKGRGLPPADRHVQATVVALLVAAGLALMTSVRGAVTAAVILMGAAALAVGGLIDRARAPRVIKRG
jgi:hypothetical protein